MESSAREVATTTAVTGLNCSIPCPQNNRLIRQGGCPVCAISMGAGVGTKGGATITELPIGLAYDITPIKIVH